MLAKLIATELTLQLPEGQIGLEAEQIGDFCLSQVMKDPQNFRDAATRFVLGSLFDKESNITPDAACRALFGKDRARAGNLWDDICNRADLEIKFKRRPVDTEPVGQQHLALMPGFCPPEPADLSDIAA